MAKKGPIVVVDDDADDQYLYQKTLSKFALPNDLIFFDNGKDAFDYLVQETVEPFLILCDINMPIMDGLELREMMCTDSALCKKNTPFIFISTSARQSDLDRASALFTHGFFQKETSFEKHEAILRKIVDYWTSCRYSQRHLA
jgi:CheY-like chemotaxis protein